MTVRETSLRKPERASAIRSASGRTSRRRSLQCPARHGNRNLVWKTACQAEKMGVVLDLAAAPM